MGEIVTAVIITRNEEHQILECLNSIAWVDEVVVVDTGSRDRTVELAKHWSARVYEIEFTGYGEAKNYGLRMARGDWILSIDADERVSPELRNEIEQKLHSGADREGYYVPRRAIFLGQPILHGGWYPGYVLRLFRREKGVFDARKVHEGVKVDGAVGYLRSPILHFTDPSLKHYLEKLNVYTSLAAEEVRDRSGSGQLFHLLCSPLFMFVKMYFLRLGLLDGMHGFVLAVCSAFHVFIKHAKIWEASRDRDANTPDM